MPRMTIILSVLCVLMRAFYEWLSPLQQRILIEVAGANPASLAAALNNTGPSLGSAGWGLLVMALFIHSGWLHLFGNIAYLWVFGIPVERRLGPFSLAFVFVAGGVLAHIMVALRLPQLDVPVIGASGAVSAVVGAYLGLFPRGRIGLFLPLGLYLQFARVPAILVIGSWFTLQLLYTVFGPINAAVAWWTHLAGFALGLSITLLSKALLQIRR